MSDLARGGEGSYNAVRGHVGEFAVVEFEHIIGELEAPVMVAGADDCAVLRVGVVGVEIVCLQKEADITLAFR
ncbi:MAG: hypothetical protein OER43_14020 [Gammaproteobacteria bacterium]|nr:hypothetical protein [Gammaproteobacteria bacterium]MDH3411993.1 hypothetical protein [Gammaproteobacteria bacterium]